MSRGEVWASIRLQIGMWFCTGTVQGTKQIPTRMPMTVFEFPFSTRSVIWIGKKQLFAFSFSAYGAERTLNRYALVGNLCGQSSIPHET
eukprot:2814634-Amphidinium_carterae.1